MQEQQLHAFEGHEEDIEASLARKISELSELHLRYTYSNTSSTSEFGLYEQASSIEQFEYKFIKDEELYFDILGKLSEVKNMVFIQKDDPSLYLFKHYQWSLQKMIKFFNEDWTVFLKLINNYNPDHIHQDAEEGVCSVCYHETKLYSSGMCQHKYCRNCWKEYIHAELLIGHIFFGCMNEPACSFAPVLTGFAKVIAPEMYELYRKKICVSYAIQNKDICYCPNQKCPYFCSKPSMMEVNIVKCPCGELYCFRCERQPHAPATCSDVQRWRSLINSQETNSTWIKNNTRECPKCRQPIEKKVGCSHMKCICLCQFCYQCNKLWDQAHSEVKGECPNRKHLQEREKLSDRIVELDESLNMLMKEAARHEASLRLCQTLVQEEAVLNKVIQVKVQVMCAWMTLKWTKILLTLDNKPEIEGYLQQEFISSIRSTMEPVQHIIKNHNSLALRDLHHYGELVLLRKEILKKNKNVWLDAFDETNTR